MNSTVTRFIFLCNLTVYRIFNIMFLVNFFIDFMFLYNREIFHIVEPLGHVRINIFGVKNKVSAIPSTA